MAVLKRFPQTARRSGFATLSVAAALGGALFVSAHSAGATTNQVTHPERDWLGSQVAKHEPGSGQVIIQPNVVQTPGLDVSAWQGNVNWSSVASKGAKFAYVKATESTTYVSSYFNQQYKGSAKAGLIRGAYHFAIPNASSGAKQADYFIKHGGGWSKDGKTLPGLLDMEWNPYGANCYGLSHSAIVSWVRSFTKEYHSKTKRWPVIYTSKSWWSLCTGNTGDFSSNDPLMVANYNGSPTPLPYKWKSQTIWQFAAAGTFPGDQDRFNGDIKKVKALAKG